MNISFWLHLEFFPIVIHDRTHTPQSNRIKSTSFSSISAVFGITHLLTCHLSTLSSHNYAINLQFLWNFHLKFSESHSRMSFCSKSTITNEKVFPIFSSTMGRIFDTCATFGSPSCASSNEFRRRLVLNFCWLSMFGGFNELFLILMFLGNFSRFYCLFLVFRVFINYISSYQINIFIWRNSSSQTFHLNLCNTTFFYVFR